jgi:hypothetical protein
MPNASQAAPRASRPDGALISGILASEQPDDGISAIEVRRPLRAGHPLGDLLMETGALFDVAIAGIRHRTPLLQR